MQVRASDGRVQADRRLMQPLIVLGAVGILIGLGKEHPPFRPGVSSKAFGSPALTSSTLIHRPPIKWWQVGMRGEASEQEYLIMAPDCMDAQLSVSLNTDVLVCKQCFYSCRSGITEHLTKSGLGPPSVLLARALRRRTDEFLRSLHASPLHPNAAGTNGFGTGCLPITVER